MDILVTYDIATATAEGQRRLARVAAVCQQFGTRVQYSVFECRLTDAALERLYANLADEIDPTEDSVHIYRFPGQLQTARRDLGVPRPRELGDPWIL